MAIGDFERYSVITEKNPREIVLLRGTGCKWRRCTFCDYHLDYCKDEQANFELNKKELAKVTGRYGSLEVINSGSFVDLDHATMQLIGETCQSHHIHELRFECHWMHRDAIPAMRTFFEKYEVQVRLKIGVETFDYDFRENYLKKGLDEKDPQAIARQFQEVCLLFGLHGQTVESMYFDINTGLEFFQRICINIMVENTTKVKPDPSVIAVFMHEIYPEIKDDPRIDILIDNTDFGVGGEKEHA